MKTRTQIGVEFLSKFHNIIIHSKRQWIDNTYNIFMSCIDLGLRMEDTMISLRIDHSLNLSHGQFQSDEFAKMYLRHDSSIL